MTAEVSTYPSTKKHEGKQSLSLPHLRDLRGWRIQALKYTLVGVSNTLIDAAAYYALTRWLWLGSLPVLAKGIAYAIGMVNSFYWNHNWTFHSSSNLWRAGLLFSLTNIAALGINAAVMHLGLDTFNIGESFALILATGAAFCWNFFTNKLVVFKT